MEDSESPTAVPLSGRTFPAPVLSPDVYDPFGWMTFEAYLMWVRHSAQVEGQIAPTSVRGFEEFALELVA